MSWRITPEKLGLLLIAFVLAFVLICGDMGVREKPSPPVKNVHLVDTLVVMDSLRITEVIHDTVTVRFEDPRVDVIWNLLVPRQTFFGPEAEE